MRKALLFLVAFGLPAAAEAVVNPGCTLSGNRYECPILTGTRSYRAVFDLEKPYLVEHIRIHNDTASWFQLNWVSGGASDNHWGEYSVYLDDFATQQTVPGVGEVASRDWDPFTKVLQVVSWDAQFDGQGLAVPPGSTVILHNNAEAMVAQGVQHAAVSYGVEVTPLTNGVRSFRQPRIDAPVACDGQIQQTTWNPWVNTSGGSWRVDGATIYSLVPGGHSTDAACIYILNTAGQVRWQTCSGVGVRGMVSFPQQLVQPGEALAAQAAHNCSTPGVWDWGAFLHVY
ncbi:MAG: hypothetical protein KDD47_16730 [Acidobacteria bacterium]|nr:hypothetical protein [Acidobacteriota bacterium]